MQDAPKTTYQDLAPGRQAGVNALLSTLTPHSIQFKRKRRLVKMAEHYMHVHSLSNTGVVIFHHSKIQGWRSSLRNPEHWVPGCIAITNAGDAFIATGGNPQSGATSWQLMSTTYN